MNKIKNAYAAAWSAILTIILVVLVTILAEIYIPFKSWLASLTGHHWITKSLLTASFVVFFVIFRSLNKNVSRERLHKSIYILNIVAILGAIIITLFYVLEYL